MQRKPGSRCARLRRSRPNSNLASIHWAGASYPHSQIPFWLLTVAKIETHFDYGVMTSMRRRIYMINAIPT